MGDLGADERIILWRILRKQNVRIWKTFILVCTDVVVVGPYEIAVNL
jgi:hypothetical protein